MKVMENSRRTTINSKIPLVFKENKSEFLRKKREHARNTGSTTSVNLIHPYLDNLQY